MFCQNCGKEIQDGDLFCSECGWKKGSKVEEISNSNKQSGNKNLAKKIIPVFFVLVIAGIILSVMQSSKRKVMNSTGEWVKINVKDYAEWDMADNENAKLYFIWEEAFDIRYEYAGLPHVIDKNSDWGKSGSGLASIFANAIYDNYSPYFIYKIHLKLQNNCYLSEDFSMVIDDTTYYPYDFVYNGGTFEIKLRSDSMPKEKSYDAWYQATLPRNAEKYKKQIEAKINNSYSVKPLGIGKITGKIYY